MPRNALWLGVGLWRGSQQYCTCSQTCQSTLFPFASRFLTPNLSSMASVVAPEKQQPSSQTEARYKEELAGVANLPLEEVGAQGIGA